MRKLIVLVLYLILGFMLYRFLKNYPFNFSKVDNMVFRSSGPVQKVVGGDRDEHGCVGSAGYTWCDLKNKCLRILEESCE